MATKTVVTRIKNKVDTLAKWQAYTGTLLDGEIAVVRVPTGETYTNPVTGADEPVVELLMKVGDGSTTFANLPWMSAKASDVYDWGKAKTVEFNTSTYKVEFKDASGNAILAVDLTSIDARLDALESKKITVTPNDSSKPGVVQSVTQGDASHEIDVTYGLVETADITDAAVTTDKIKDANVTTAKIANGAVSTDKIANGAVTNDKVAAGVSSDKISIGTGTTSGTLSAKLSDMDGKIAANATAAAHSHPYLSNTTKYAGSSSVGGAATSANKVNKSITFKNDGSGAASGTTFDGSTARTISYNTVGAAAASHTHDDRYYTETEINAKVDELNSAIDGKSSTGHTHDDRYYTETEVDNKIAAAVSSALKYKGTKDTTAALPTSNNAIGDVYNITNACAASETLPKVNAGDNVAWNGTSWDVLAGTVDLSSYYNKSEVNAELAKKSDTSHTHSYAGSSSAGGAANSVKAALTFSTAGDGTTSSYNGSTARKISYNSVGAAPVAHTHTKGDITDFAHNHDERYYTESEVDSLLAGKQDTHTHPYLPDSTKYAGSATKGGAANSVANSLSIQLNSGTATTFDGSAAKSIDITPSAIGAYTKTETDAELAKKSDTGHTHSSYVNQNAFSSIKVSKSGGGSSDVTVAADTATDTVTFVGSNITITGDATNDKVTFAVAKADADGETGIVTLEDSVVNQSKTAATSKAVYTVNVKAEDAQSRAGAIEGNYVRFNSSDSKLYVGKSGTDEIIFDCGGAE